VISEPASSPAGEQIVPSPLIPANQPPWATALPLWAAARWLWITVSPDGGLDYQCGGDAASHGPGTRLSELSHLSPYPLIVLDCGAGRLPPACWPQLAALLAPGGVLFACGFRRDELPAQLQDQDPAWQPAAWHVLEPSIDGVWCLRPDAEPVRRLLTEDLQPPYGVRDWLTQLRRRWQPASGSVPCLPVWRGGAPPLSALLAGALPPGLLSTVAQQPRSAPPALLHLGREGTRQDRHLLFLLKPGARYPFALIKWARGGADGLEREHAALTRLRAASDPILAASCPPSWGPFAAGPDTRVTVERYLPARASYAQLRTSLWPRRLVARHFARAATWLAHFAAATRQPPRPFDAALLDEYIAAPLALFRAQFGPDALPARTHEYLLARARAHLGVPIALTAEHGDLWLANLLLPPKGGMYVIDWEYFQPTALPGFDLLLFSTTYALELPSRPFGWMRPDVALYGAYCRRGWLTPHMARLLRRGCAAAGLPRTLLPVLLPLMMARMALRRASGSAPGTAAANNFWITALQIWWQRPTDSWLDSWSADAVDASRVEAGDPQA
jgi:hypothetical protein